MINRLSGEVFARSFSQRVDQLAWFLGAGASAAAGIPTAGDMIADFKTRLFCARTGIPREEVDSADPLWAERISAYFDGTHGFPPAGHPSEYSTAFEAVFPQPRDRRSYIEELMKRGTPSYAHRVLASLISTGSIRCLFTTNFDPLVERATVTTDELLPADRRTHLTVSALDSAERAVRCLRDGSWPLLVKLHGDYKSDRLKNVASELQSQDQQLRGVLTQALGRFGLVVVGYSGRDDSIMDALGEAVSVSGAFPSGLWWVNRPGTPLLPRVEALLEEADNAGIEATVIESENFDELAGEVEREVPLEGPLLEHVRASRPAPLVEPAALPTIVNQQFPVVRCSAVQILELPSEATLVVVDRPLTSPEARRLVKDAEVWATVAARGREVLAFGPDEGLHRAFASVGGRLDGTRPIQPSDDSVHLGLVYDAFTRAIARRKPLAPMLRSRGHSVLAKLPSTDRDDFRAREARQRLRQLQGAYSDSLVGVVPQINVRFVEAIQVRLERWHGRWWCVFAPFTWVDLPRRTASSVANGGEGEVTQEADAEAIKAASADWRRERWAQRYNAKWNAIIAEWAELIADEQDGNQSAHHFDGEGMNALFSVSSTTAWCSPARSNGPLQQ